MAQRHQAVARKGLHNGGENESIYGKKDTLSNNERRVNELCGRRKPNYSK